MDIWLFRQSHITQNSDILYQLIWIYWYRIGQTESHDTKLLYTLSIDMDICISHWLDKVTWHKAMISGIFNISIWLASKCCVSFDPLLKPIRYWYAIDLMSLYCITWIFKNNHISKLVYTFYHWFVLCDHGERSVEIWKSDWQVKITRHH